AGPAARSARCCTGEARRRPVPAHRPRPHRLLIASRGGLRHAHRACQAFPSVRIDRSYAMSRPFARALRALPLVLGQAFLDLAPARACSVCLAGDPVFEASGASVGETGQWNLFVQGSGWVKRSGTLPGEEASEEKNESRRLDVYLGWTPI